MGDTFIDEIITTNPAVAEELGEIKALYQKQLWHQVSEKLDKISKNAYFLVEGRLISIFQNFVSGFKDRLNALFLAQFVIVVSKQFPNVEDSIVFISKEKDDLSSTNNRKRDPAAITLLKLQLALCKLNIGLEKDCKLVLDEVESELKGSFDAVVHSKFYEVLMYFHKAKSHASLFFKNALLFLGYTDLDSISHQDQIALASDLALSALVGEDIFNFGELLQHQILKVLNDSGFSWLYELLFAFNSGNIQRFEEIFSSQSNTQAVLLNNVTVLHRKIRILALMELVFQRPSIDRTLSFPTISQACQLPLSDVELLVMKALSLGVIRGQIDQVEGSVRVHWVQPRVLDTNQIRQVGAKVQQWISNVRDTTDFLEKSGPEIFHSVSAP